MRASRVIAIVIGLVTIVCGGVALVTNASAERAEPTGALTEVRAIGSARDASYDNDGNWASPDEVFYYRDGSGNLAIVNYSATGPALLIDTYDEQTFQPVGQARTIPLTGWPRWGGFYAAPDGSFFVLVGRDNHQEEDAKDVVAVRHYSPGWDLLGTALVKGAASQGLEGIYEPFAYGSPDMLLVGNRLVVHMSRLMYETPDDGLHHQANLTFEVAVDTMTAKTFESFRDFDGYSYSSHSFQQLLTTYQSALVMLDHGDAFPRAIQIGVMPGYPAQREVQRHEVFGFNGAVGDNFTGAGVTGLVSGPGGVVVVGRSIRHPNAPNGQLGSESEARNAFLLRFDPASGAVQRVWLTDFAPGGASTALEPRVVRLAPDRWAVLFSVRSGGTYRTEYRLIDSSAAVLASATFDGFYFSPISDPFRIGPCVLWVGVEPGSDSAPNPAHLFGLDVGTPAAPEVGAGACGDGTTEPTDPTDPTDPTTDPTDVSPPVNVEPPRLVGGRRVGAILHVDDGSWSPEPDAFDYRWYRDDRWLRRKSGVVYAVRARDRGHVIRAMVVASIEGAEPTSAWTNGKRIR